MNTIRTIHDMFYDMSPLHEAMIDHRSYTHSTVVKLKPEKKFRPERDSNP